MQRESEQQHKGRWSEYLNKQQRNINTKVSNNNPRWVVATQGEQQQLVATQGKHKRRKVGMSSNNSRWERTTQGKSSNARRHWAM